MRTGCFICTCVRNALLLNHFVGAVVVLKPLFTHLATTDCADSPMWERFSSINNTSPMNFWGHSGVTYAQPAPSASFEFYDYLLSWGESVGETAVFSDFMGDQTSIQQMNMGLERDEVRDWLLGFDAATLKHHMTMQMCMQLPSNLMQSLEMDSVTNARSSGDGGRR